MCRGKARAKPLGLESNNQAVLSILNDQSPSFAKTSLA
jgi:hypothetical protein